MPLRLLEKMFEICFDWKDAPGVEDPMLAQTWAFLTLRRDGQPMLRFHSERTRSVEHGIHVSVLPLAHWIVDNEPFLLDEGLPVPAPPRGASARGPMAREMRQWLLRHNMFTCREGMAYPDLAILRERNQVAVRWFRDPHEVTTPGRFIDEGSMLVERKEMEKALDVVVERVFERTRVHPLHRA